MSVDVPKEIKNNLPIEFQRLPDNLKKYYSSWNGEYKVHFYSNYFKKPIGDIIIEQLYSILSPIPTTIFYTDITDYSCRFNVSYWGLKNTEPKIISSELWNWEETIFKIKDSGINEINSFRMIRDLMVSYNQLLASYLIDISYLSIDPYYQFQFPQFTRNLGQNLTENQQYIDPYFLQLKQLQEKELGILEEATENFKKQTEENIRANAQKWTLNKTIEVKYFMSSPIIVNSIAIHPQEPIIAGDCEDNKIRLWDANTGKYIYIFLAHSKRVNSLAFNPDGLILASVSSDDRIKLWNCKTKKCIATLQHTGVNCCAFSPDGLILATGSDDKTIKLWHGKTGNYITTLKGHLYWIRTVAFSPDGKILASGSSHRDDTINIWDLATNKVIFNLKDPTNTVSSLAFSPDNKIIANGSYDKTIKLWNIKTRKLINTLNGHTDFVRSTIFSLDGLILASAGDDNTIKLWNWKTGECIRTLNGHSDWVNSIAFSADGHTLVSGSSDGTIKIWQDI